MTLMKKQTNILRGKNMCVEIIWDDDEVTWDDIPYDVKEMVEYGLYTKEEVLKEYNNGRKRHRQYIDILASND